MKLAVLLARAGVDARPRAAVEITGVTEDSRAVTAGSLFVAIHGAHDDGTRHAADAIARGAAAVVAASDRPSELTTDVPWIAVGDDRLALAALAAAFHGSPGERLELTAITGSKGKTTTSFLCAAVADAAGGPTALFGTIMSRIGASERPQRLTTPAASTLHRLLREAVDAGMHGAVIEVSSHALAQRRVHPLRFSYGLFTNLFPDHLDYHRDVDAYFEAKRRLFRGDQACARAVIGTDGEHGQSLAKDRPDAVTFGSTGTATVNRLEATCDLAGVRVRLRLPDGEVTIASSLLGRHNT